MNLKEMKANWIESKPGVSRILLKGGGDVVVLDLISSSVDMSTEIAKRFIELWNDNVDPLVTLECFPKEGSNAPRVHQVIRVSKLPEVLQGFTLSQYMSVCLTYARGHELSLTWDTHHFFGFKPAPMWTLTAGEWSNDGHGYADQSLQGGYMAIASEYFAESDDETALKALLLRSTDMWRETGIAKPIDEICEKEGA